MRIGILVLLVFWLIELGGSTIDFEAVFQILTPKVSIDRPVEFQNLSCFRRWHERDKHRMQEYVGYILNHVEHLLRQPGCHSMNTKIVISGNSDLFTPYFNHFPHFSDFYFRAYSILLWQRVLYPQLQQDCIQDIAIPSSYQNFWKNIQAPFWNQQLVLAVNKIFGRNVLISDAYHPETSSTNRKVVVVHKTLNHTCFHPSDAVFLTAAILNHHPCEASQQQQQQQQKFLHHQQLLNITIINRKSRGILNLQEVVKSTTTLSHQGKVTIHDFDGLPFQKQVSIMFYSDITISSHGAALTNIVFMKPCSVVIEILPWLYHGKKFFHRFANSSDVLHYEWMESPENSIRHNPSSATKVENDQCSDVMKEYFEEYSRNSTYRQLDNQEDYYSEDSLNHRCSLNAHCFSCARSLYGFNASTSKLETLLLKGNAERLACLKTHPYYSSQ
jgi:hypothetical protein